MANQHVLRTDAALEEMVTMIRRRIHHITTNLDNNITLNLLEDIEDTVNMVVDLSQLMPVDSTLDHVEQAVSLIVNDLGTQSSSVSDSCTPCQLNVTHSLQRGRPAFQIPEDTLVFLLDANFKVKDIADLLSVSKRTIERRMQSLGIGVTKTYSLCSDGELQTKVSEIVTAYPGVGYRTVKSILKTQGIRVQELRVREAVKIADPEGVVFRRIFLTACRVQRRTYNVSGPQALWHMGGHHKLIRYTKMSGICSSYTC